jgi:hypothetical protein
MASDVTFGFVVVMTTLERRGFVTSKRLKWAMPFFVATKSAVVTAMSLMVAPASTLRITSSFVPLRRTMWMSDPLPT